MMQCHATILFARKGYNGASIAEVSRMSIVAGAAIYDHFESKASLLTAVLILFSMLDGIIRLNTHILNDNGTLHQELLTCFSRMLRAQKDMEETILANPHKNG